MATINPTITRLTNDAVQFQYPLTTADNDGAPIGKQWADFADRTVSAHGSFGGGTVNVQGAADGANWASLNDPSTGTAIALIAAGSRAISELPRFTRPILAGSTGAAVTVTIIARRERAQR